VLAVEMRGGNGGDEELGNKWVAEGIRGKKECNAGTWLPLVLGPELAIESRPGVSCLSVKFSSGNFSP
jgi:hypothetical protein